MHKRRLLFFREPQVFTILQRHLISSGYRVFPKVRLADAINLDPNERVPERDFQYLCRAHLDFVVVKDDSPVFAVEFDGAGHLHDDKAMERDILKNRLCKAASLPLLRISSTEIAERDRITLLDYMLVRFVAWEREIPQILEEIQEYAENLPDNADPADLAVDLDPSFHFNLRHPFPGLAQAKERLWRNHRIASFFDHRHSDACPRYLCTSSMVQAGALRRDQFYTCITKALVWPQSGTRESPVFSQDVEVTIRSWLPLNSASMPDVPFFELASVRDLAAALERFKIRVEYMWFPELPGLNAWDIAENYGEYLGFRAIEKWAKSGATRDA